MVIPYIYVPYVMYMNHFTITLYVLATLYLFDAIGVDRLTLVTETLLLVILQYFYGVARIITVDTCSDVQKCTDCQKMTPQRYVHCPLCDTCVPTNYTHYPVLGTCTDRVRYTKYACLVRMLAAVNILLTIIVAVFVRPWMALTLLLHLYVLKSMYLSTSGRKRNI